MMKSTFAIAAVGTVAAANIKADVQEAAQIIGGMMDGIIQTDNLSHIEACLTDAGPFKADADLIKADFKKGGIRNYVHGFEEVVKMAKLIPGTLKDCESIKPDVQRLEQWAAQFKHPWSTGKEIMYNTYKHFSEVKTNVEDAAHDFEAKKYYSFGQEIGDTLVVLTNKPAAAKETEEKAIHLPKLPKIPVVQIKEALSFIGGVSMEFIKADNLKNTEHCIKDGETIEKGVAQVISNFKLKTMEGYLNGIKALGEVMINVPTDAKNCEAMKGDLPKIKAFISQLKDPKTEMENIGKNLWNNFDAFKTFTEATEAAFDKKDFYYAGLSAGKALWTVMEGTAPKELRDCHDEGDCPHIAIN